MAASLCRCTSLSNGSWSHDCHMIITWFPAGLARVHRSPQVCVRGHLYCCILAGEGTRSHSQSDIEVGTCPSQVLWEVEREGLDGPQRKQSFVDLGCGNGLLVYLLASEGVSGRGE